MNDQSQIDSETQSEADAGTIARGHERDTVNVRLIGGAAGGLILIVFSTLGLMAGLMAWMGSELSTESFSSENILKPELHERMILLDPDQPQHLAEIRQQESSQLTTYGWVDRKQGIARIPIQRAMQIIEEQGLDEIPINHPPAIHPEDKQESSPQEIER